MARIFLEKFEPADGGAVYTFPRISYEYESTMGTRSPQMVAIGADYALRLRGTKKALKEISRETVRCAYVGTAVEQDTEWDAARLLTGRWGKVWLLRNDGVRRWAWAECAGVPELTFDYRPNGRLGQIFSFERFSDWFAETQILSTTTITTSGQDVVVSNTGNLPCTQMVMRLRANAAAGITNPIITNLTNGYVFQTNRDSASTSSEIRLDTRRQAVEFSTDDGVIYTDDFANYQLPPVAQKILTFRLEPGSNTLDVISGGTPNFSLELVADAPFA